MKRLVLLVLCLSLLLSGCTARKEEAELKRYTAQFLTLFDTVTTIVGYAPSEEDFRAQAQSIHDELERYHQLFDVYEAYPGLNNLYTINQQAGVAPVEVGQEIIDLLLFCREAYQLTGGMVDVTMGSVLLEWHNARTDGIADPEHAYLPDPAALKAAAEHTGFDHVVIDQEASTVYLDDPLLRLDVGAIAKGYAAQKACAVAPEGMLISVGGNVCATGPKPVSGESWVIGIQDPDGTGSDFLHTVDVTNASVVTSGDYQRYYTVDGVRYSHIIHPETLYPATLWRSVSVICPDSGLADALSTALFLLPLEDGLRLVESCGAHAMWVDADRNIHYSPGFPELIRT